MSSSQQLQELQKMQRMQQQMQAQLQQQQASSQQQLLGSNTGLGSLPQMSQMGFSNQQWLDPASQGGGGGGAQPAQRNSMTGMNSYMMQQQNNSAHAAMYWNALQAQNKGSSGTESGNGEGSSHSLKNSGGGSALGMMDTSMQSLLQQQTSKYGVGGSQQMRGQSFTGAVPSHGSQTDLSNSMLAAAVGGNNAAGVLGGSAGMMSSTRQTGQLPNASSSSAQLLLHQQNMIENLQRQLQEQRQNSGSASVGTNESHAMHGIDRRASSSSTSNLMSNQQQASILQNRGSASSNMIHQMRSGMIQEQGMAGAGSSIPHHESPSLSNMAILQQQQQQRKSLTGNDQSILSLMGSQNQQRRASDASTGNSLIGNAFGTSSPAGGAAANHAALLGGGMSQLSQLQGFSTGLGASNVGTTNDPFRTQQHLLGTQGMAHLMSQTQKTSQMLKDSQRQDATQSNNSSTTAPGGKGKSRRQSLSSKSKRASKTSDKANFPSQAQQTYLDGTFAGGWQSNKDLADRRQIIFNIVAVIEQMRPDANKMSQKLPMMAKRLEEHLYRSAQTREEYLDQTTLKKRLQMIAHGLEVHRSTSTGSSKKGEKTETERKLGAKTSSHHKTGNPDYTSAQLQQQLEQLQQLQQLKEKKAGTHSLSEKMKLGLLQSQEELLGQRPPSQQSGLSGSGHGLTSVSLGLHKADISDLGDAQVHFSQSSEGGSSSTSGILKTKSAKYQDTSSIQKKKVIRQQQQRLLLLRHASKCTKGAACETKFCPQMVSLWKHMKKCRDRNCKTAHCLSSRCVLNHYRICKAENKTSTCEVCAPVMKQIKLQSSQSNEDAMDVFVRDQDKADTQELDLDHSASTQISDSSSQQKRRQLEELQAAQQKLQQQQLLLKQLQQQQAQLLEQQKQLQHQQQHVLPQTPQGQQLQQQEALLQQLQQQFQQQQQLLQQELLRKPQGLDGGENLLSQTGRDGDVHPEVVKSKRRSSQSRRSSASRKSQASSTVRGGKAGFGKGKRLSSSKTGSLDFGQLAGAQGDAVDPVDSATDSKKRSALEIKSEPGDSKRNKVEHILSADEATERLGDGTQEGPRGATEKVLQQGNEEQTTALIPSMSISAIERHLESLSDTLHLTPRKISQNCIGVLRGLLDDQFGWVFKDRVDPVALGLPDYFDVVKNPMHLALVEQKLVDMAYKDMESFERDTKLVFENAILYNGDDSEVGTMARSMLNRFEKDYAEVLIGVEGHQEALKKKGDACFLCGSQRRLFEPAVLYCNGECGMQKIRRNSFYYSDKFKLNHWCVPCYALLKDDDPVILDNGNEVRKKDLQKFKNDALPEEAWVQCDCCHNWVHQICALFNGRKNKMSATYTCPKCHIQKTADGAVEKPENIMKSAKDIPRCKMSDSIENGLEKMLAAAYQERADEFGLNLEDVEKAEGLSVRVVSDMEKTHCVREKMLERYRNSDCPSEFPLRSKCIALFQNIHGVDVLLFGLYVYEYDHACPAPNRRRVYISYLDSVHYFEPPCYRTITYHAILIEYLRFVKKRGFHTAHIWSCPPSPGDDYIFYCHPENQRVPRDEMLRGWYRTMLEKAESEGVVLQTRTLYDEYFKNDGKDATLGPAIDAMSLPYFEGDYIPGEIENIIKELGDQEDSKRKDIGASKKVGNKLGTRSNPGELVNLGQDKVMIKLGQAISNMRQNFIVVHLRSRKFAAAVERGDDVSKWIDEDQEECQSKKKMRFSEKDSSILFPKQKPGNQMVETDPVVDHEGGEKESEATALAGNVESETKRESSSLPDPAIVSPTDETRTTEPADRPIQLDGSGSSNDDEQVHNDSRKADMSSTKETAMVEKEEDQEKAEIEAVATTPKGGSIAEDGPTEDESRVSAEGEGGDRLSRDHDSVALSPAHGGTRSAEEDSSTADVKDSDVSPRHSCGGPKLVAEDKRARTVSLSNLPIGSKLSDDEAERDKKRSSDALLKESQNGLEEIEPAISRHFDAVSAQYVNSTVDEDDPIENELFESRQQLLNYCQTNHFQFDELRRAKHTTMMILFQLHNPTAPKFLQQCGSCYREITHGKRYHCNNCSNFDLCQDCYEPVVSGLWAKRDSRFAHNKNHTFTAINTEAPLDTRKNREDRARALKIHLELLVHAANCKGPPQCTLKNCEKMKALFRHVESCEISYKKGCKKCSRLLSLMTMHARQCTVRGSCPIPFCDRIRERNRRLRQQQQLMDDRRRNAQNALYRERDPS